jgi:F-type H+-transporting ATPase subunit a
VILGLEFPPVSHLVEWPEFLFENTAFAVNKVVVLMWLSAIIAFVVFYMAGRQAQTSLVPTGLQNLAESVVDFIREQIILQTIGPDGLRFTPFLLTMFVFILIGNLWEVIPIAQMPSNGRIAFPALLAIVVWIIYNYLGIRHQGFFGYFKNVMFPPGVPKPIYVIVTPIELVSRMITQPFALAVRLFANMLAGHLLLVTFALITAQALAPSPTAVISPFSFVLLVALTGFEVLVAVLQAFIYTILTSVYIGGSLHPEH